MESQIKGSLQKQMRQGVAFAQSLRLHSEHWGLAARAASSHPRLPVLCPSLILPLPRRPSFALLRCIVASVDAGQQAPLAEMLPASSLFTAEKIGKGHFLRHFLAERFLRNSQTTEFLPHLSRYCRREQRERSHLSR